MKETFLPIIHVPATMPSRRSILASCVGISLATSGCQSGSDPDPADHVPDEWHDEPARATGYPIETTGEVDESTDDVEYVPEEDAVRHPDGELEPADEWLGYAQLPPASKAARAVVRDVVDADDAVHGPAGVREFHGYDYVLVVRREVTVDREGDVVSSPETEFSTLRNVMPRSCFVTFSFEEGDHECEVPAYVSDVVLQLE